MRLVKLLRKYSLHVGIFAMILLVAGTFAVGGSLLQKILFLVGVPLLGFSAFLNKQKMYTILQLVVTVAAILAFFDSLPDAFRYGIMLGAGLLGIGYLVKINYFKQDVWWPVAGLGLLSIAAGFATNAALHPVMFNSLLAFGGMLVAAYSAIGFFHFKVKIAIIWLVMNIIFAVNPTLIVLHSFGIF